MRVVPTSSKPSRVTPTLSFKCHAVKESAVLGSIRAAAKKYNVQPSQIRHWKKGFESAIQVATITSKDKAKKVYKHLQSSKKRRMIGGGRKMKFPPKFAAGLKELVTGRREKDLSVSMHLIEIEAKRINPELMDSIPREVFLHRMYRLMNKWSFSYRRKTHKAQNTRICQATKNEFIEYQELQRREGYPDGLE